MRQNETADDRENGQFKFTHWHSKKKKKKVATFSQDICKQGDVLLSSLINSFLQTGFHLVCGYQGLLV